MTEPRDSITIISVGYGSWDYLRFLAFTAEKLAESGWKEWLLIDNSPGEAQADLLRSLPRARVLPRALALPCYEKAVKYEHGYGQDYACSVNALYRSVETEYTLLLDPDEPRARAGRLLVSKQLPWRPPTSVGADLLATIFFWHQHLRFRSRQGLFLLLWPLAFVLLALARRRRWALWPGLLCLVAGGALLGSLYLSASSESGRDLGVVRVATLGRSGDSKSYSASHSAPLPAGTEVRVLEERSAWIHVSLPDGSASWLPAESVVRVLPQ